MMYYNGSLIWTESQLEMTRIDYVYLTQHIIMSNILDFDNKKRMQNLFAA